MSALNLTEKEVTRTMSINKLVHLPMLNLQKVFVTLYILDFGQKTEGG